MCNPEKSPNINKRSPILDSRVMLNPVAKNSSTQMILPKIESLPNLKTSRQIIEEEVRPDKRI